ncbi:MAG: thiol-disulfide isomerase, partial [Acidobacteria bacterium]|nr:thiol-disulfide isomerase [Acidobacteriota bacterium]
MPLLSYADTRPWARSIASKVRSREMPPWFADAPKGVFRNERGLSEAEIATIVDWVAAGAPAGDPAFAEDPASAAAMANGWTLGEPDFVVRME